MKRLTPQDFDECHKKNLLKELEENPKGCVVGCLYDLYFSDNKLTECSKCCIPLYLGPWLLEAALKHNLRVVCQFCVDPKELKGKIIQDITKIEQAKMEFAPSDEDNDEDLQEELCDYTGEQCIGNKLFCEECPVMTDEKEE